MRPKCGMLTSIHIDQMAINELVHEVHTRNDADEATVTDHGDTNNLMFDHFGMCLKHMLFVLQHNKAVWDMSQ